MMHKCKYYPEWDTSQLQGTPQHSVRLPSPITLIKLLHLGGNRRCERRVSYPTMRASKALTQTARSGVQCSSHEVTAPPILPTVNKGKTRKKMTAEKLCSNEHHFN